MMAYDCENGKNLTIPFEMFDKNLILAEIFFLCLLDFYEKQGERMNVTSIAHRLGYSNSYGNLIMQSLVKKGYVKRVTVRNGSGIWDINFNPGPVPVENEDELYGSKRMRRKARLQACGKRVEKP